MTPELIELALIAEGAGRILVEHYRAARSTSSRKVDGTFVTSADLASDSHLRQALEQYSKFPIISEEEDAAATQSGTAKYWLVDPLDGTLAFMEGNGEFAICIALMDHHKPIIGVIHGPITGEMYVASKGTGAFHRRDGNWIALPRLADRPNLAPRTVVMSRHHDNPVTQSFVRLNDFQKSISMGSALKFARVACGEALVYPNFDGSAEWDTAAGHALVEAVGGSVIDVVSHQPLAYGKPRFRNPFFLAFGPSTPFEQWRLPNL